MSAHHFINNQKVAAANGQTIPVIDPSTGLVFAELARGNATDIETAVQAAEKAYAGVWSKTPAFERGRILTKLSQKVLEHAIELRDLEAQDCGKPLKQAHADVLALARYFEFYAGAADKLHGETIPYQNGYTVLTLREPHGVVGHIIPWNYPMQIFWTQRRRGVGGGQCVRG